MQLNEAMQNEKAQHSNAFFELEHKHDNPISSLDCVHVHQVYYRLYNMIIKKHPSIGLGGAMV